MFRKLTLICAIALGLGTSAKAQYAREVENFDFSFEGPFGSYDQVQLQRGFKIFTESCAGCHGLKFVSFRNLADEGGLGYSKDQVRAYAATIQVFDAALLDGEGDYRPAKPADLFPEVTGSGAPDLSLMAKARYGFSGPYGLGLNQFFKGMGGAEYIASFIAGYTGEEKEEAGSILYRNVAFRGGWTSMPPPLVGGDVEFDDGSPNDLRSEAQDIAAFLMWTAEPKMTARKKAGFTGVLILGLLSVLLYFTNKRIWAPHKNKFKIE